MHQGSGATAELWARRQGGRPLRVLVATGAPPDALLAHVAVLREQGIEPALTSQRRAEAAIAQQNEALLLDRAVRGLLEERPTSSAASPAATWQLLAATICVGLAIGGLVVVPDATYAAVTALIALPFLCVALLRVVALQQAFAGPARQSAPGSAAAHALPGRAAALLHRARAAVPGSQHAARARSFARRARLSRCQARSDPGARGHRPRDPGGVARHGPARQLPHARGARPAASHQAQGTQLRPPVRARRLRRCLRCRGPPAARSAAQSLGGVSAGSAWARLPAGPAQHLQSLGRLVLHAPVHDRVLGAVRRHPAGAGASAAAGPAGRHVEPLSPRHARRGRRLGPPQRHRGRRPRHPSGPAGLPHGSAGLDDMGGGAAALRHMAQTAHTLDEGLDADLSRAHARAVPAAPRPRRSPPRSASTR